MTFAGSSFGFGGGVSPSVGDHPASATGGPLNLYVDGDNGDDNNPGTQAEPLATITEAESRIPDIVNDLTKIWVQPASSPYTMPDFRERVYRANLWVVGGAADDDFHFTELLGETSITANSAVDIQTAGGLGVNTYRGKMIEILTGDRAGDLRMIRDHTDDTIVPANGVGSGDSVSVGDTFRIVEPAVEVTASDGWLVAGEKYNPDFQFSTRAPGVGFMCLRFQQNASVAVNLYATVFGCEVVGTAFSITFDAGWTLIGSDAAFSLSGADAPVSEVDFSRSRNSFRGWGLNVGLEFLLALADDWCAAGLVARQVWPTGGGRFGVEGGAIWDQGVLTASKQASFFSADKPPPGDIAFAIASTTGDAAFTAIGTSVDRLPMVILSGVSVTSDGVGILAVGASRVRIGSIYNLTASGAGIVAQHGGQVYLRDRFINLTTASPELRVVDGDTNMDYDIADIPNAGDYIAAGDGSVIQRLESFGASGDTISRTRITPFTEVEVLEADRTVGKADHDTFFVCDTDSAGAITITIDEGLVGVRMWFRLKGGDANVTFTDGSPSTGVTIRGGTSLTAEDGVAELIYDESSLDVTIFGDVT